MGYTHYFEVKGTAPTKKEWEAICGKVRGICARHADILCEEYDTPHTSPVVNAEEIRFNGKGDEGHETFLVSPRMEGFNFCKTAEKDYDIAVVESLKAIRSVCPEWLSLHSDGGRGVFA